MGDIFLYIGLVLLTSCIFLGIHLGVVNRKNQR